MTNVEYRIKHSVGLYALREKDNVGDKLQRYYLHLFFHVRL
jgi:hypothetical protein